MVRNPLPCPYYFSNSPIHCSIPVQTYPQRAHAASPRQNFEKVEKSLQWTLSWNAEIVPEPVSIEALPPYRRSDTCPVSELHALEHDKAAYVDWSVPTCTPLSRLRLPLCEHWHQGDATALFRSWGSDNFQFKIARCEKVRLGWLVAVPHRCANSQASPAKGYHRDL